MDTWTETESGGPLKLGALLFLAKLKGLHGARKKQTNDVLF